MSALSAHVRLLRRVRRLLPTALATVAMLAPADAVCWERSPLSRLRLRSGGRGAIGLRLERRAAAALRERGTDWLRRATAPSPGDTSPYSDWRCLRAHGRCVFWSEREDARLALLLDPADGCLWLFWQEEGGKARCRYCS
ncbi:MULTISPECIES: hypothetical protein [Gammaproteobacteria]|uniref:hypothetical protein n=1 Tax=Gammaproteobacteria TaxID=1236 RepID=UPI00112A361E|nr:hypothetical protein [Pseudomonas sp. Hp2]